MVLSPTLLEADRDIVTAASGIKVLSRLSWPVATMEAFLDGWQRGRRALPDVSYPPADDLDDARRRIEAALGVLGTDDEPVAQFLRRTAESYLTLCEMLAAAGSPAITAHSVALYGRPGDPLADGAVTNLHAAHHFLTQSAQYSDATHLHDADYCLPATAIKADMEARLGEVFPAGTIAVVIDAGLASKAAAGSTRIRLRDATCFSAYDLEQLLNHEAFVHSLTALNGRAQPAVRCLALGAPRTTGPQEGLATFSEMISGAIDIARLKRIALRIVAIDMALSGADFIEVFEYFLGAGQPRSESFNSAMRVFRGAPVTGGAAFTKDAVYLHGLMEVHTFFRWALQHQKLELCRRFFAGRMTIGDVIALGPAFEDGTVAGPTYLPPWMTRTNGLAGYLAFSIFANRISIDELGESYRFDRFEGLSPAVEPDSGHPG